MNALKTRLPAVTAEANYSLAPLTEVPPAHTSANFAPRFHRCHFNVKAAKLLQLSGVVRGKHLLIKALV